MAVRDALELCRCPVVEVHVTNIYGRPDESWRANSDISEAAVGVIAGFGVDGYSLALSFIGRSRAKGASPATSAPITPDRR